MDVETGRPLPTVPLVVSPQSTNRIYRASTIHDSSCSRDDTCCTAPAALPAHIPAIHVEQAGSAVGRLCFSYCIAGVLSPLHSALFRLISHRPLCLHCSARHEHSAPRCRSDAGGSTGRRAIGGRSGCCPCTTAATPSLFSAGCVVVVGGSSSSSGGCPGTDLG